MASSSSQRLRLALLALALGIAVLAFLAGRLSRPSEPRESTAPRASAEAAQVYTCAMHPQVRSADPDARCPICGMELIPVPRDELGTAAGDADVAGDGDATPRLRVSARAAALMQVRVWPVERRAVRVPLPVFGRLEPDERRLASIAARVDGRVDHLHIDFAGVTVEQGQPVADIYSPALIAAQEELLQARQMAATAASARSASGAAEAVLLAARDKLRLLGFGPEQIEQIERRGAVSDHLTVRSPLAGTVLERHVATGDYVQTGQMLLRIADLSELWLILQVYEADLPWLRIGDTARFTAEALPGVPFEGTVTFIDPSVDDATRTVRVRVDVENAGGLLKPGMFVRGAVDAAVGAAAHAAPHTAADGEPLPLVIPASAPLLTGRRALVYVQSRQAATPTFEARDVVLGPRAGDWYAVYAGLEEGELVVVHGQFRIDSELQIRGRPSMMAPEGGGAPVHDHGATREPGAGDGHGAHATTGAAVAAEGAPAAFRTSLADVVRENFALVEALAADDLERTHASSQSARTALGRIDPELLDRGQRQTWGAYSSDLEASLDAVGTAGDLQAARAAFERFSDALWDTVRTYGVESIGALYRAMCPMVQGREGYWLQESRAIRNPYHGAAMLTCGDVVEEIAPADR